MLGKNEVPGHLGVLRVHEVVALRRQLAPRFVVALVSGRGDVEAFAAREFHARGGEVKLQALLVLVAHPQDVVLVGFEAGEGVLLEAVDEPLLHVDVHAFALLAREGDDAVGVALLEVEGVDEVGRSVRVASDHLGVDVPVLLREVVHELAAARPARLERDEFEDHEAWPSGSSSDRSATVRRRSSADDLGEPELEPDGVDSRLVSVRPPGELVDVGADTGDGDEKLPALRPPRDPHPPHVVPEEGADGHPRGVGFALQGLEFRGRKRTLTTRVRWSLALRRSMVFWRSRRIRHPLSGPRS